ncbi:ISKra4 family transposase [Desulfogranum mediterraneum]|uniref:ISKra4 family transposase n=1 Tax=Desulfogranum mediterraneum TaxID=160661 RepID=UPI00041A85A0|nr:ISKra4 family transposase [Desulfogranum mediterraneum]
MARVLKIQTGTECYKDMYDDSLDQKISDIIQCVDAPNNSLFKIIENVRNIYPAIDPELVQIIIQGELDKHVAAPRCTCCGAKAHKKYSNKKECFTTIGTITITCPYYACPKCKAVLTPYEDALNLRDGKYQYDIQKIAALFGAKETFEETAEMMSEIYRVDISPDTVHKLTNQIASEVSLTEIIPTPKEVSKIVEDISRDNYRKPVLVFSADGAMVPIRTEEKGQPHCWREAKGIRGYLLDKDKIVHLLSWHQVSNIEEFKGFLANLRAQDIIPLDKVRLCFVGDGADWIWDCVKKYFPECRQVLDYYHCSEHLYDFAKIHFTGQEKAKAWVEETKVRLFHNNAVHVIAGLNRMKCKTAETEVKRNNLFNYLKKNIDRVEYGRLRRGGYPLGSGAIESSNKFISNIRLKRSGAWWKVDYANNILKLRCAKYNSKFDSFFEEYESKAQAKRASREKRIRVVK